MGEIKKYFFRFPPKNELQNNGKVKKTDSSLCGFDHNPQRYYIYIYTLQVGHNLAKFGMQILFISISFSGRQTPQGKT